MDRGAIVIMIWNDSEYGLIKWHQQRCLGHFNNISFNNSDFVKYAELFGAKAYRVESASDLLPTQEKPSLITPSLLLMYQWTIQKT